MHRTSLIPFCRGGRQERKYEDRDGKERFSCPGEQWSLATKTLSDLNESEARKVWKWYQPRLEADSSPEPVRKTRFDNEARVTRQEEAKAAEWVSASTEVRNAMGLEYEYEREYMVAELKTLKHRVDRQDRTADFHKEPIRIAQSSAMDCQVRIPGFEWNWPTP